MKNVLWADDDCFAYLELLPSLFAKRGCLLHAVPSYDEAIVELNDKQKSYDALIVDIILPRKRSEAGLARDLGMRLAQRAIGSFGIQRVCFLTVVPEGELSDAIDQMKLEMSPAGLGVFDKTILLETDFVGAILEILGFDKQ